jgi:putative methionine-R-sulfoxide reductase with GAF domain
LCAAVFGIVSLPGLRHVEFFHTDYLLFHSVVEIASIVVSFAVFIVGWYGYKQHRNPHDLFIGVVFLVVAILDLAHTLSYKGMPPFLTENTVSKASTLWIAARLVGSIGLVAAGLVTVDTRQALLRPGILLAGGIVVAVAVIVVVVYFGRVIPPMYIEGSGQTPLKIALEWLVIVLLLIAIFVFGRIQPASSSVTLLRCALVVSIFSELGFSVYKSPFDSYNMVGHLFKATAYYLIFKSLFVSSFERPYRELVKARDQVEDSFAKIGMALASSLDLDDVLQLIADLASDILGSKHAVVMLLQNGELRVRAWRGICREVKCVPTEHTAAGLTLRTGKATIIPSVSQVPGHSQSCHCQQLDGLPAQSIVSAPIQLDDRVLGVIEVYSPHKSAFKERDAELLSSFARQAAVAIKNSIAYERERLVATALQKGLLPVAPSIRGLDIAVRYTPAEDEFRVGGDLYDVFAIDDHRVALVIGDVCGHGLDATSIMAMTVLSIRSSLLHGMSPGKALQSTNLALCRYTAETTFVTVFASVLNTHTWELQYANAGHVMPVILRDNLGEFVELHSDIPLAVEESAEYATYFANLADAKGLILYTDGLIEARRQQEMFGDEKLAQICTQQINYSADQILEVIVSHVRQWSGILTDDIAIIAVKRISADD